MSWVLIVTWCIHCPTRAVAMQEFSTVEACQFASVEVQKLAPVVSVVCVPKGNK